jgi:hypothetical protein
VMRRWSGRDPARRPSGTRPDVGWSRPLTGLLNRPGSWRNSTTSYRGCRVVVDRPQRVQGGQRRLDHRRTAAGRVGPATGGRCARRTSWPRRRRVLILLNATPPGLEVSSTGSRRRCRAHQPSREWVRIGASLGLADPPTKATRTN